MRKKTVSSTTDKSAKQFPIQRQNFAQLVFAVFFILSLSPKLQAQSEYAFYILLKNGESVEDIAILRKPSLTNWKQVSYYEKNDPEKTIKTLNPEAVEQFSTIVYRYFSLPCQLESGEEARLFVAEQRKGLKLLYHTSDEKGRLHLFIRHEEGRPLEELPAWSIREFLAEKLPDFDKFVRDYRIQPLRYDLYELEEVLTDYAYYLNPELKLQAQATERRRRQPKGMTFHLGPEFSTGFRQMKFVEPSTEFEDFGYLTLIFTGGLVMDMAYTTRSSLLITPRYTFYGIKQYPDSTDLRRNTFVLPFTYRYTHFTGKRFSPFAQLGFHVGINAGAEFIRTYNGLTKGFPMDPLYGGFQAGLGLSIRLKHRGDFHCTFRYEQSYGDKIQTRAFPIKKEAVQFKNWNLTLAWMLF